MSAVLMKDRLPSEVGDSDTYNRLQMRRAIQTRGDPTAETPIGTAGELLRVLIVDDYRASADTMAMLVRNLGTRCQAGLRRKDRSGTGRRVPARRAAARHHYARHEWT